MEISFKKTYISKIHKDKAICSDDDIICNYWSTSYYYSNQQISCYTPIIPIKDRINFSSGKDYQVYLVTSKGMKYTCNNYIFCKVNFHYWRTPVLKFINSSNFYAGSKISFRLMPTANHLNDLLDIKVKYFYI
jgi:hypothetical protein